MSMYAGQMNVAALQAGSYGTMQAASHAGDTAPRQSEVESEMNKLANAIAELATTAEMLASRLEPVRRRTGNLTGKAEPGAPEPVLCEMAAGVRDRRYSVERVLEVVRTSLGELEI